jgi:endonuclease/exonuclease/phosphatase family metal-dependent hydrolase
VIDRIENFFRAWRRRISRSELAIKFLRLSVSEGTANEPGLVLIQIDGLSRRQMERAMERGRLPFLKKLIRRENYETRTFYSGVPSSTPAVQGELHYGVHCAVPAFGFMDRELKQVMSMLNPAYAKTVEERISKDCEGLLKGGSSWSNIYRGGADLDDSHFCCATMGIRDLLRSQGILQSLAFPFLHFFSFLRIIALLVVEFFLALWDFFHGWYKGENLLKEAHMAVARVLICIGMREIITIGVKTDIARGLPIIHLNFVGYDEQAHRRGPSSLFAHWTLLGIDRAIRMIYHAAERSTRRDYQVWVFSDHGQESTRIFSEKGVTPEQAVYDALQELDGNKADGRPKSQRPSNVRSRQRGRSWVAERQQKQVVVDTPEQKFTLAAVGPVGHLYFPEERTLEEKRALAKLLVEKQGVPGVLVRNEDLDQIEWFHAKGVDLLPDVSPDLLPHPDELKSAVAQDLKCLCHQDLAGDVVLLGWAGKAPPLSFAEERGSHAGPGVEETQGFTLLPPLTRLPAKAGAFMRPEDLRATALHYLGRKSFERKSARKRTVTQQIRIMTYNVHSCRGMDGKISPRRIAKVIEQYNPDVVALQELDLGRVRSQKHDQPRLIAEELGMHLCFCPTVVEQGEQYGHALLSHFPMEVVRTQHLCKGKRFWRGETRGALWVRFDLEGMQLNMMNTHFGLGRAERVAQAADLLGEEWIGGVIEDEPLILCGDFNMLPRSQPYRALTRRLRDVQIDSTPQNTFSSFHAFARIDHVFVSRHFIPSKILVPRNSLTRVASDHLPLIVDLNYQIKVPVAKAERMLELSGK